MTFQDLLKKIESLINLYALCNELCKDEIKTRLDTVLVHITI